MQNISAQNKSAWFTCQICGEVEIPCNNFVRRTFSPKCASILERKQSSAFRARRPWARKDEETRGVQCRLLVQGRGCEPSASVEGLEWWRPLDQRAWKRMCPSSVSRNTDKQAVQSRGWRPSGVPACVGTVSKTDLRKLSDEQPFCCSALSIHSWMITRGHCFSALRPQPQERESNERVHHNAERVEVIKQRVIQTDPWTAAAAPLGGKNASVAWRCPSHSDRTPLSHLPTMFTRPCQSRNTDWPMSRPFSGRVPSRSNDQR